MSANQYIVEARKLLRPVEVELHKYPVWLKKLCRTYRKNNHYSEDANTCQVLGFCRLILDGMITSRWMDHTGRSIINGKQFFVSEPYRFDSEGAKQLDLICSELGIKWRINSNSWWFPGNTLRIEIHEKTF